MGARFGVLGPELRSGSVKFGFHTSKSSPGTPPEVWKLEFDRVLAVFQNGAFACCVLGTLRPKASIWQKMEAVGLNAWNTFIKLRMHYTWVDE